MLKSLLFMNIFDFQPAIESHISGILKSCIFLIAYNSGIVGGFSEHQIPLLDIAPYDQSLVVFIKLIKVVGNFLSPSLNGKISLT